MVLQVGKENIFITYFSYLHVHHTHLLLVYVSQDTIKQTKTNASIQYGKKMNAYMHLLR